MNENETKTLQNDSDSNIYIILYKDENKLFSRRKIRINSSQKEFINETIYAYCYLFENYRKFDISRISRLWNCSEIQDCNNSNEIYNLSDFFKGKNRIHKPFDEACFQKQESKNINTSHLQKQSNNYPTKEKASLIETNKQDKEKGKYDSTFNDLEFNFLN